MADYDKKVTLSILTYYDEKLKQWTIDRIDEKVPAFLSDLINDTNFIDNTVSDLVNYYDKDTIDEKISNLGSLEIILLEELPEDNIKTNAIYLIPSSTEGEDNKYDEYLYVEGNWERIGQFDSGSLKVDLTEYLKKDDALELYILKSDLAQYYTKNEIDQKFKEYYRQSEVDEKIAEAIQDAADNDLIII